MICNHDFSEQDIAVGADGMCPLCLAADNAALRERIEKMRDASEKMLRALNKNTAHSEVLNYCLVCKAMSELRAALPSNP